MKLTLETSSHLTPFQEAQRAYEQALEKDPGLVDAKVGIASVLLSKIANAWSPFARQDLARADQLLLEAIEQNANNAWARCMMAGSVMVPGR